MNTKICHHGLFLWCAAFLVLMPVCGLATTKDMKDVDLDAFIRELSRLGSGTDDLALVVWFPEEFWAANIAQDPTLTSATKAELEAFFRSLRAYTMVAVRDGTLDALGEPTFRSEQAIRQDIRIIDLQGNAYAPLPAGWIDAHIKELVQSIESGAAELSGLEGENTHVLLFPSRSETGARIADAGAEGQFRLILGNKEFRWRLPLDSILLDKACPQCVEQCKGSWSYCPWCGGELTQP